MYSRNSSGLSASDMLVNPRTSENRMLNSAARGSMLYFSGSSALLSTSSGGTYWPNSSVNWRLLRVSTKYPYDMLRANSAMIISRVEASGSTIPPPDQTTTFNPVKSTMPASETSMPLSGPRNGTRIDTTIPPSSNRTTSAPSM